METNNLSGKEFKVMVINILTKLGRRMDEHNENLNKEMENIRKYHIEVMEVKNSITENTLGGLDTRRAQQHTR